MKSLKIFAFLSVSLIGAGIIVLAIWRSVKTDANPVRRPGTVQPSPQSTPAPTPSQLPAAKTIPTTYHVFQTFNNCAPAALSLALSYYGIHKSQEELANDLRPYNNPKGVNDDKSTTPDELGAKAEEYGLTPYFRANGSIDLLKRLIANDMPVVMRTLLEPNKDFAHYRVIKGYDDTTQEMIQDDSFQGKNIRYSYGEFLALWKPFNYEYLVLAPPDKREAIKAILGEEADERIAWQNAVRTAEEELLQDPEDIRARFNLSVALYYVGDYERSVNEFKKIESVLPKITMWYQIEPIRAYAALGDFGRVFVLSDKILSGGNPAFSELYILRGESYVAQGNTAAAKEEFEKAVLYNRNLKAAKEALASVSGN